MPKIPSVTRLVSFVCNARTASPTDPFLRRVVVEHSGEEVVGVVFGARAIRRLIERDEEDDEDEEEGTSLSVVVALIV